MVRGKAAEEAEDGGDSSFTERLDVTLRVWTASWVQLECKCPSMRILVSLLYFLS